MSLLDSYTPVVPRTLPVVLLLDASGSMREDGKIEMLNDSVTEMIEELTEVDAGHGYITLSIITFGGSSAEIILAHTPIGDVEFSSLRAGGRTPLGEAFRIARQLVEDHDALLAKFSGDRPHEASEAAEIRNFLRFVTTTVSQVTMSASEPDVAPAEDSAESLRRLQSDDAF